MKKFYTLEHPNTGDFIGQMICQQCIELDYLFNVKREAIHELAFPDPAKGCSICGATPSLLMKPADVDCPPTGRQLKESGQDLVMNNEREAWKAKAMEKIEWLCKNRTTITADDVRSAITAAWIGKPHHPNVFGALMKAAARNGWIIKTGHYEKSNMASRHSGMLAIWKSLIC